MKSFALLLSMLLVTGTSFAAGKTRLPAAATPTEVKELAAKLKREVRTRISAYNISADEANGCSSEGVHYNVKVQVKKAVRALDKEGNVTVKHTWETVREVDTDGDGAAMEICLE